MADGNGSARAEALEQVRFVLWGGECARRAGAECPDLIAGRTSIPVV